MIPQTSTLTGGLLQAPRTSLQSFESNLCFCFEVETPATCLCLGTKNDSAALVIVMVAVIDVLVIGIAVANFFLKRCAAVAVSLRACKAKCALYLTSIHTDVRRFAGFDEPLPFAFGVRSPKSCDGVGYSRELAGSR